MKTAEYVWIDDKLVKWNDAKVHVATHSLHYGSAVFEGIHSYKTRKGTAIFRLDGHIERLFYSAKAFGIKLNYTKRQIKDAIKKLIKINKFGNAYIRPLIYYGYGSLEVYPKNVPVSIAILALPLKEVSSKNFKVKISKFLRLPEKSTVFGAKISGNYANSILAMHEARKKGYDEALMLDYEGFVAEGPAENIFLVKDGSLITPSSKSSLPGITRDSIIKISRGMGVNVYEKKVKPDELKKADEIFFCGTLAEIDPIVAVDNKKIGNGSIGKLTLKIRDKFYDVIRGRDDRYKKWLTYNARHK